MPVLRKGEAFPQDRRQSRSSAPARLMVIWTSLSLTPPPSAGGLKKTPPRFTPSSKGERA